MAPKGHLCSQKPHKKDLAENNLPAFPVLYFWKLLDKCGAIKRGPLLRMNVLSSSITMSCESFQMSEHLAASQNNTMLYGYQLWQHADPQLVFSTLVITTDEICLGKGMLLVFY